MSLQSDASQIAWDITQNPCVGYSQPERLTIWNLPSPTSQAVNVNVWRLLLCWQPIHLSSFLMNQRALLTPMGQPNYIASLVI